MDFTLYLSAWLFRWFLVVVSAVAALIALTNHGPLYAVCFLGFALLLALWERLRVSLWRFRAARIVFTWAPRIAVAGVLYALALFVALIGMSDPSKAFESVFATIALVVTASFVLRFV